MSEIINNNGELWILLSTSFLSSTLLPGGSEVNLAALVAAAQHPIWLMIVVATVGNTLGGLTNYGIGRILPKPSDTKPSIRRASSWIEKFGIWALLLSWLPIVGDPLCLVAGWTRLPLLLCSLAIIIGKGLRYLALAAMITNII